MIETLKGENVKFEKVFLPVTKHIMPNKFDLKLLAKNVDSSDVMILDNKVFFNGEEYSKAYSIIVKSKGKNYLFLDNPRNSLFYISAYIECKHCYDLRKFNTKINHNNVIELSSL